MNDALMPKGQLKTIPGTDSGSVYFVIGETNNARLAFRPFLDVVRTVNKEAKRYEPWLFLGGRLRVESKEPTGFPNKDYFIDNAARPFQLPELRQKSGKHGSTEFTVRIIHPQVSHKEIHAAVKDGDLLNFIADGLLSKLDGPGVTALISKEQIVTLYEELLNDKVPNVAVPLPEKRFLVGRNIGVAEGEAKPVPQYGQVEPDEPEYSPQPQAGDEGPGEDDPDEK